MEYNIFYITKFTFKYPNNYCILICINKYCGRIIYKHIYLLLYQFKKQHSIYIINYILLYFYFNNLILISFICFFFSDLVDIFNGRQVPSSKVPGYVGFLGRMQRPSLPFKITYFEHVREYLYLLGLFILFLHDHDWFY